MKLCSLDYSGNYVIIFAYSGLKDFNYNGRRYQDGSRFECKLWRYQNKRSDYRCFEFGNIISRKRLEGW